MASPDGSPSPGPLTLSGPQQELLHRAACRLVSVTARGKSAATEDLALGSLGDTPVVGVFVTLRKNGSLRGCIGNFTPAILLSGALERAATGVACHDPRFAPVRPDELALLTVEISLLHSREQLGESADERLASVEIGQHGLDIQHHGRSGLLLPSVAVDQRWDVFTFLCEVCRKAGLPIDTWRDPQAALYRFAATHWSGPFAP
jgi:uncharacterized protein